MSVALLSGIAGCQDAFAQTFATACSGCHTVPPEPANARVNAAPLASGALGADAATGLAFIGSANTRHGMVAGTAGIVSELQTAFALTAQARTVAYGGSSGSFAIAGLFQSPGNGVSLPLVTGTAPNGGGNGGATSGTLTTSTSSFNVTYAHAPAAGAGQCGPNVDSFRVVGTGGGGTTPTRLVNVTISNPTLTPGGTSPTISYNTVAQTITLSVSPATVALTTMSVGVASEGTATATGALTFTYAASATPTTASVTVPFTINTVSCGTISGSVAITISPAIISAGTAAATQGLPFTYQINSIPAATAYSMTAPDQAALTAVGLSFVAGTGQITGTPTVGGTTVNVTVNATTPSGGASRALAITIANGGTPAVTGPGVTTGGTVTGANAVTGTAGTALNIAYAASNPVINAVGSTGLPAGLSFSITNAATGAVAIAGTPSQSQSAGNSNVFTVQLNATNASGLGVNTPLTLTINPSVVATLTSATLTPSQNTAFSYDFLAGNVTNLANSAQITFSATGLPTGLSINASTGVISGTATGSGGPTVATVTATNAFGAANASVTFNITPTTVPGISSPTAVSGTINTAITPVQIIASNPPLTGYSGTGLPPGITVSPTGLISGTPTSNGTFNATLTATNAAGPGSLVVPFVISAVPASIGAATMTVPLNTPTTVDLAAFITGTAITGVQIISNPSHGQVTANGTQITFTPATNYFGTDSFSIVAFGTSGASAAATVTVNIVGRPDPSADATVAGTINSQIATARRFSQSQIGNFQRRMESLHRGGVAPGNGDPPPQARGERNGEIANAPAARPASVMGAKPAAAMADAGNARLRPSGQTLDPVTGMPLNNELPFTQVRLAGVNSPVNAGSAASGALAALGKISPEAAGLASPIASFASNRTLNLASIGGGTVGSSIEPAIGGTSVWMGGDARFGTRDPVSGQMGGTSFSTDGVSAGIDRRVTDKLVLGVGVGYASDKSSIGTDGTQSRSTGASAALYGSYQLSEKTYIDALLGYGVVSMDTDRFVSPLGAYAASHRTANQLFGSVTASYEIRKYDMLFSPYGRLDFTINKLKQTAETGVGNFSLTYFDQTDRTLRTTLGLRAESAHESDWGIVRPRMRFEYQHGFAGGGSAQLAYSDLIGGPSYLVNSSTTDRNTIVAGVGGSLEMRNGLKLGLDYQISRSFTQETSQAVRVTLEKEFDGKGSYASLLPPSGSSGPPLGLRVDAGYMYDSNVSRGRDSGEKLSDQSYTLELNKGWQYQLAPHVRAVAAITGGGEKFHNYEGLSRLYATLRGELQYRTSGSFGAPTYALFARATGEAYESYLRDGYRTAFGLSVLKPVTDRITLFGALTHNERHGDSAVFTGRDNSARINVDYAATANSTLYFTTEYRKGDTVSSGLPSLASLDIAKVFARDDAFIDQLFAYRFEASTVIGTVGYNLPFGRRDALDFSYRHVQTTSSESSIVYGKSRYRTDQMSVTYLLRF